MKPLLVALALVVSCERSPMHESESPEFEGNPFIGYFKDKPGKLGTSALLVPPSATLGSRGDWVKALNATAPDAFAAPVTISIRAEYSLKQPTVSGQSVAGFGTPVFGQPLVGRIRWGTGGAYNIIDFDVPPPASNLTFVAPQSNPVDDIGNGITITLAGAAFEVQIRNDANLSYLVAPGASALNDVPQPALILASINPPQGPGVGRLTRTIYMAGETGAGFPMTPGAAGQIIVQVPAFADKVWFPRFPSDTTPIGIQAIENNLSAQILGTFQLSPNEFGPIELTPSMKFLIVRNLGGVNIQNIEAMFSLNPP